MKSQKTNRTKAALTLETTAESGYSLIDLLIASALCALLVLGLAQTILYACLSAFHSDSRLQAAVLAYHRLESLRALPFDAAELREGFSARRVKKDGKERPYILEWDTSMATAGMKEIFLRCRPSGSPKHSVGYRLYINQRLGF